MSRFVMRRRVPPAVALAAVVGTAAAGVVAVSFPPAWSAGPADQAPAARAALPPGSYPAEPLSPGTPAPSLEAAGWINGPPEAAGTAPRLVLLDIWSGW